jgi:hypothetical protein
MEFEHDDEEQAIADTFGRFFERESTLDVVRAAEPLGFDAVMWDKLRSMGVPDVAARGLEGGATTPQLGLIAEAAGTHLAPAPVPEALAFVRALSASGHGTGGAEADDGPGTVVPRPLDESPVQLVPGGAVAAFAIASFHGRTVLARRRDHHVAPHQGSYGATPLAEWAFDLEQLTDLGDTSSIDEGRLLWTLQTAAALVGTAHRAIQLAADYAKERVAYNTVIGKFQGVAHPLADAVTACEGARLLVYRACSVFDDEPAQRPHFTAMASAFASEMARQSTRVSAHVHGGYGASLEVEVSRCHARATAWSSLLPSPRAHYVALGSGLVAGRAR